MDSLHELLYKYYKERSEDTKETESERESYKKLAEDIEERNS